MSSITPYYQNAYMLYHVLFVFMKNSSLQMKLLAFEVVES